jgi:parallel beta-helix repeat protein
LKGKALSGIVLMLLSASILAFTFDVRPARAQADPVYIRADGSLDPPTAPILTYNNVTYVLNGSIYGSIVVERNDIVIDGAGCSVQGGGSLLVGIDMSGRNNVTVKNVTVAGSYYGILINSSSNICLIGNSIEDYCFYGVYINGSSFGVRISGNTFTINNEEIWVDSSSNCTISGNIVAPSFGDGIIIENSSNNIISANNMSGYYVVKLENSSNNSIDENIITPGDIFYSPLYGIYLSDSSNNNISANDISGVFRKCEVFLSSSTGNRINGNIIDGTDEYGLFLESSSNNVISGNVINETYSAASQTYPPIFFPPAPYGVVLYASSSNSIVGNNITSISYSLIVAFLSSENRICYNRFVSDSLPVLSLNSINTWDDGKRGNYWSNYNGTEKNHDGIGDTPYVIDSQNSDHFPVMGATRASELPIWASLMADLVIDAVTLIAPSEVTIWASLMAALVMDAAALIALSVILIMRRRQTQEQWKKKQAEENKEWEEKKW